MVSDTPPRRRTALLVLSFAVALSVLVASAVMAEDEGTTGDDATEQTADESTPALEVTKYYIEIKPGIYIRVEGRQARRQARIARWVSMLEGDRRAVYETYGFPNSRHRESFGDRVTEHWSYVAAEKQFIFRGNDLIREARY